MFFRYIISSIVIFNTLLMTLLIFLFIGKKEARTYMQSIQIATIIEDE